jgi:hypothetical protein
MSGTQEKPICWMLRTEFELEPLLEQFVETYSEGNPWPYQIVFKDKDERTKDFLYVILFFSPPYQRVGGIRLEQFLDAYCKLHNQVGAINEAGFPTTFDSSLRPKRLLGNLNNRRKT